MGPYGACLTYGAPNLSPQCCTVASCLVVLGLAIIKVIFFATKPVFLILQILEVIVNLTQKGHYHYLPSHIILALGQSLMFRGLVLLSGKQATNATISQQNCNILHLNKLRYVSSMCFGEISEFPAFSNLLIFQEPFQQ